MTRKTLFAAVIASLVGALAPGIAAQETGTITGVVSEASGGMLQGIQVSVEGTGLVGVSGVGGDYRILRVPLGQQTVVFRRLGYQPHERTITVRAGNNTLDVALEAQPVVMGEIVVEAASRAPERIVEAPAAVTLVDPEIIRASSITAQAPIALSNVPGVDLAQSGMNDFNVNARGFNSSLNRRILVMQDGRDLAIAFLGSQEWNAMTLPLEEMGSIEMVRGPGSALYGANAFSGVINISTPLARDVIGTKVSLGGGELETIRADVRHAGLVGLGRFGYRVNAGFNQSDSWSISRTRALDIVEEYREATDRPVTPSVVNRPELVPLNGQTVGAGQVAQGTPEPVRNIYGSTRLDYYGDDGDVGTVEGGIARVENEVFVTGIGRVQVVEALRPWARVSYNRNELSFNAWYNGRTSLQPQVSLGTSLPLEEKSSIWHLEGQFNRTILDGSARVVFGSSARLYNVNTSGTLMAPANDDRSDKYYSAFGQFEYRPTDQLRLVAAGRYDDGDLFSGQVSPKGAIVFSPNQDHSVRATFNRAFQTPNYSEFFLNVPLSPPSNRPGDLEGAIESLYQGINSHPTLGPVVADLNLPNDLPWDFEALTRVEALGNEDLEVEKITSWEIGYKGSLSPNLFVGVDFYLSRLKNFVSDLLPGVNPDYPVYALDSETNVPADLAALDARLANSGVAPDDPLRVSISDLQLNYGALNAVLGNLFATAPNGERQAAVSYGNSGRVEERGFEISLGYLVSDEVRISGSYSFFDFEILESDIPAEQLLPNTPKHKASVAFDYVGRWGLDANITARFVDSYEWSAGVFAGTIPASQLVNLALGYQLNPTIRLTAAATNVLDQRRFQVYGGSVIGRRLLAGATATF